jgi:hypothetical protein
MISVGFDLGNMGRTNSSRVLAAIFVIPVVATWKGLTDCCGAASKCAAF